MEKIMRNSLLYKSKVEYADFCLNHVEGCSHGCRFPCYAMQMAKRFGKTKSYRDWIKPKLVENALELLENEIPKYKNEIKFVHLCFMTDPFMYKNEEVEKMTLQIIEKLNENGIKSTVLTKGILPKELCNIKKYGSNNEYGITLVSLNEDFKRNFEPFSAPYVQRINSLKRLKGRGSKIWVSIEPYPTPNLVEQNLSAILEAVAFVDRIIFGKMNYNVQSSQFKDNGGFFEKRAKEVIDFCKDRGIDYHIKNGTQRKYNSITETLFKGK
jgi:DNA repair photolyase